MKGQGGGGLFGPTPILAENDGMGNKFHYRLGSIYYGYEEGRKLRVWQAVSRLVTKVSYCSRGTNRIQKVQRQWKFYQPLVMTAISP
ncbi:hypothetical protein ACOMHN_052195 [Nucella lapillus]